MPAFPLEIETRIGYIRQASNRCPVQTSVSRFPRRKERPVKRTKKLVLSKETLQKLDGSDLRLFGGEPITGMTCFCTLGGGSCLGASCQYECTYQAN